MVALRILASLLILCVGREDGMTTFSQPQTDVEINIFKVEHEEACLLQVVSEHDVKSFSQFEAVSIADLTRARQAFPSAKFTANSAKGIRKMLNHHLRNGKMSMPLARPCEEFSLKELGLIQQQLATGSNQELWSFASAGSRTPRHDTSSKLAADIIYWDEYVQSHPDVTEAVRDGRCHEVALQWVHHLTDSTRLAFSTYSNISMPLLPKNLENHTFLLAQHPGVKALLNEQLSCQTGHSSEALGYEGHDADWPVWPNELTYEATTYGIYPFWKLGFLGGLKKAFFVNTSKHGHLRTYFSATHNQARYDHSECPSLPDGLQFIEFPLSNLPAGPCTNLFLGDGTGFLYSRVSDRSFCCMTSRPVGQGPCRLTAVPYNFIDKFDFIRDFNYSAESGSYEGLAKLYARKGPDAFPVWFWYVTTPEGLPVEQGEGYCLMYGPDGTRTCTDETSTNHAFIFHQYHPETVERWEYNSSVFDVPEVCMGEIGLCGVELSQGVGSVMCVQDYDAGYPVEYDYPSIWENTTVTYMDSLKRSELDQDSELMSSYMRTNPLQVDASQNRPRPLPTRSFQLVGSTPAEIADKLNEYAKNHVSVQRVIPCAELDEASINTLASKLRPHVVDDISQFVPQDDGRGIQVKPWEISEGLTKSARRRDMMCAETMKMWAHHIPNPDKVAQLGAILPSLPSFNMTELQAEEQDESLFYNRSLSCVIGHNVVDWNEALEEDDTNYTGWPTWPKKLHYSGVSFGPYPFWQFGGPYLTEGWHVNLPFDTPGLYVGGHELEVWHSTPLMRTKFFHRECRWLWGGHPELGNRSCAALQANPYGSKGAFYLYTVNETTKMSDEKFCCEYNFGKQAVTGQDLALGTLNRKFVESMKYIGQYDINTTYYSGPSKVYVVALPGTETECPACGEAISISLTVYYWTDLEGKPLRFGEIDSSKTIFDYDVLHEDELPLLYEEFDPTSYVDEESQEFPDSILDLPEVCKFPAQQLEHCSTGSSRRDIRNLNPFEHDA